MTATWAILAGDCRESLATLDAGSVQTCVTSPPYFNLRDYDHDGQIGAEANLLDYGTSLREVFRAVHRVLRDDGTLWLNLGDSYDKRKSLIGVPWEVAHWLKRDGWLLRCDVIWRKTNPKPEGTAFDRPSRVHEYLFLLAKRPRYFYDGEPIREENAESSIARRGLFKQASAKELEYIERGEWSGAPGASGAEYGVGGRNKPSVWDVATVPVSDAHFATFPPKLIEPCILAGSREGDTVLDPFTGSGTTGMVALRHNRSFIGCELNPAYVDLARDRIIADSPLLNTHAEQAA